LLRDQVRGQLEQLIPLFGVSRQTLCVLAAFDMLCGESLALDANARAPEHSRINTDGTPFQFALTLGRTPAPLQFLSEAGRPRSDAGERLKASYAALRGLAGVCGVAGQSKLLMRVLRDLLPGPRQAEATTSGYLWFALAFWADAPPALTVYVNGRVGSEPEQWQRLERFADLFGSVGRLHALASLARPLLGPLGMAVTLRAGAPPRGRIYLHAFGAELTLYRALFLQASPTAERLDVFEQFAHHVLGDDVRYPTRSGVFSIELPDDVDAGVKLELCAHCAFAHDADAARRVTNWLTASGLDEPAYQSTIASLTGAQPLADHGRAALHAYVGVGVRGAMPYASIYLNPGALVCA